MPIREVAEVSVEITAPNLGELEKALAKRDYKATGEVGAKVRVSARARVAPGAGPGPHPHRTPHVDMGNLMRNIVYRRHWDSRRRGWAVEVGPKPAGYYGTYLELGWHTRSGTFYKYPWLRPAYEENARWASDHLMKAAGGAFTAFLRDPSKRARSVKVIKR